MHSKKLLLTLCKFGISAALLGYVIVKAQQDASFAQLRDQPKHWGLLLLACLLLLGSAMVSFYRWYLLVRALDLPFRVRDALRLGFLGYLLNFVSLGSVGGDLFKAVFIAREQHGHRTEAVATVIIDRLLGLYCLMLVGVAGSSVCRLARGCQTDRGRHLGMHRDRHDLHAAADGAGRHRQARSNAGPSSAPIVGGLLRRLVCAIRMYRNKYTVLVLSLMLGIVVHGLTVLSLFCVASGLPGEHPTLAQHFVIVPLGMLTGILPLPLGALGAVENVMDYLYVQIAGSNMGVIVTFGYRANTILVAMIGACYYLGSRREFSDAMHEAETEQDEENAEEPASMVYSNPAIGHESAA